LLIYSFLPHASLYSWAIIKISPGESA
jgi:hypothetical protein